MLGTSSTGAADFAPSKWLNRHEIDRKADHHQDLLDECQTLVHVGPIIRMEGGVRLTMRLSRWPLFAVFTAR